MSKFRPISGVMAAALACAYEHGGKLTRHQGGYWAYHGWRHGNGEYFGTTTVNGLVKRGRLRVTEWKQGRGDRFPVEAEIVL